MELQSGRHLSRRPTKYLLQSQAALEEQKLEEDEEDYDNCQKHSKAKKLKQEEDDDGCGRLDTKRTVSQDIDYFSDVNDFGKFVLTQQGYFYQDQQANKQFKKRFKQQDRNDDDDDDDDDDYDYDDDDNDDDDESLQNSLQVENQQKKEHKFKLQYADDLLDDYQQDKKQNQLNISINGRKLAKTKKKRKNKKKKEQQMIQLQQQLNDIITNQIREQDSIFKKPIHRSKSQQLTHSTLQKLRNLPQSSLSSVTYTDFKIHKRLSKGAYGYVALAQNMKTNDLFALKIINKKQVYNKNQMDLLMAQKQILSKVNNDFVVHGAYSFNGPNHFFLAMQYMPGGDLAGLLVNQGRIEYEEARFYLAEIVQALEYLRSIDCVHRDLKPDNILLDRDGHLKLTDFGLSRDGMEDQKHRLNRSMSKKSDQQVKANNKKRVATTQIGKSNYGSRCRNIITAKSIKQSINVIAGGGSDGQHKRILGTPNYMSPEVINGNEHSFPVDYWSLGVICYQMVAGAFPFQGNTVQELFQNIKSQEAQYPDINQQEWPEELDDFIKRLLDRNPKTRLGAADIEEIKNHAIFKGINWKNLREMQPPIDISSIVKDPKDYVNFNEDRRISDKSWDALVRLTQAPVEAPADSSNNNKASEVNLQGSNKKGAKGVRMEIVKEQTKQQKIKDFDNDFNQKNVSYLQILNKQDALSKIASFYKKRKDKKKKPSLMNELLPQTKSLNFNID